MTSKVTFFLLMMVAQNIRDHTRPSTNDPARARYKLEGNTKDTTQLSDEQAADVTLTLNPVSIRPIQTWVRTAGRIDKTGKVVSAYVHSPESAMVKVGQRVRAFPPESKSSMFQAWVTKVVLQKDGAAVEVTLSSTGRENTTNYVLEIVAVRGEFLSIPNEAIIEEGTRRVVYVQRQQGQYVPVDIETGVQGELYTAVLKGLMEGDQVVSFGSFFIDSEYKLKSPQPAPAGNDQPHH
jgi:multidrug efflux pump subunit AcrA (membrane-fusion protein)